MGWTEDDYNTPSQALCDNDDVEKNSKMYKRKTEQIGNS